MFFDVLYNNLKMLRLVQESIPVSFFREKNALG